MRNSAVQMSLWDIHTGVSETVEEQKPELVHLLKVVFTYGQSDLPLMSGYVKIGKPVESPWWVKLHYGKARVFVKAKDPKQLRLTVSMAAKD